MIGTYPIQRCLYILDMISWLKVSFSKLAPMFCGCVLYDTGLKVYNEGKPAENIKGDNWREIITCVGTSSSIA